MFTGAYMIKKLIILSIFHSLFLALFVSPSFAAKVFPNPWIPESKTAGDLHGTLSGGINFQGLPGSNGTIYIYNTTGELVRKIDWSNATANTIVNWDGKNTIYEYVASGVYIWVARSGGAVQNGKIVVIR